MSHTRTLTAMVLTLLLLSVAGRVRGQDVIGTQLVLMPHCTEEDRSKCPDFAVQDPLTLRTDMLAIGDLLDIDVIIASDTPSDIGAVRSWLQYDPQILEARSIELSSAVNTPYPGEQDIDAAVGLVKIGGVIGAPLTAQETAIARVTFRVLRGAENAKLRFHLYRPDGTGNTTVLSRRDAPKTAAEGTLPDPPCINDLIGCQSRKLPLLRAEPASLLLSLPAPVAPQPAPTTTTATSAQPPSTTASTEVPTTTQSSAASAPNENAAFGLLQVQGVRITSRDRDVYVGWIPLRSSALKEYNVYYGTTMGQYMLRKTVPSTMQSLTIRDMNPGSTVYVALRAVSMDSVESAFSQEVSVVVGDPQSSTAPLLTEPTQPDVARGENPLSSRNEQMLVGETGIGTSMALLLGISAAVGTAIAARRQFSIHSRS